MKKQMMKGDAELVIALLDRNATELIIRRDEWVHSDNSKKEELTIQIERVKRIKRDFESALQEAKVKKVGTIEIITF